MDRSRTQSIKKAQKESLLFQEVSKLYFQISLDDKQVDGLSVSRIKLSDDGGICFVYFYCAGGLPEFEQKRKALILYKPSLRSALAKKISSRYTPELVFQFDDLFEKHQRIEKLLDSVKEKEEE